MACPETPGCSDVCFLSAKDKQGEGQIHPRNFYRCWIKKQTSGKSQIKITALIAHSKLKLTEQSSDFTEIFVRLCQIDITQENKHYINKQFITAYLHD